MTVLEIINRVLRRLREDAVVSISDTTYSYMVGELLHDIHQELLDIHRWSSMEHVIDVPVDASQRVLDLTRIESSGGDVDNADEVTKNDSLLLWHCGLPCAWVFDDSSEEEGSPLYLVSEQAMEELYQTDRSNTATDPTHFSLRRSPSRDGLQMTIWPVPTTTRHIRMKFWTPEDEIDLSSDSNRTLLVPSRLLVLGTIMLALNERGEELGEPGHLAERRYYEALGAAMEADKDPDQKANVYEMWRD